ncbi:nucleoside-diphosphate kinase [Candidatus Campbellbacteria bacterium]|nr:MAG: nucleoside-diphosphate kinase [Candidatus Campbellbacteria bacterium]
MTELKKDKSLVLIKPDGVQRGLVGDIINRFEKKGLKIVGMKMIVPTVEQCEAHYNKDDEWFQRKGEGIVEDLEKDGKPVEKEAVEYGKDIIRTIVKYMTGGPVVAMVLEGHKAPEVVTSLVGTTEPVTADMGTIRGDFTIDSFYMATVDNRAVRNIVHCSEDDQEAARETKIWFAENELMDYTNVHERILYDVSADGHWKQA